MSDFFFYISTALALIFVIEGLLYALFPDMIRKMMAMAIMMETNKLRRLGVMMALTGLLIVWLLQNLMSG